MMDIGSTELLMIVIVAIVVIGPKDLPRALYKVGQVIGKAKGMARHFRSGIDAMVREVELEEMEKKWKADNERIMREYAAANPAAAPVPTPAPEPAPAMEPLPEAPAALGAPPAPVTEGER
ncbi:hypothetical protein GCM10009424_14640 [Sphingomonas ursincola]|uniref:Twin-arginine translocase subunit TatB n=1 Tax=Sphingomonas ursincola TaxID=56361 RepID=A0A7V8RDM8_9SPHN|nr:Sec-independent protein translocase protein TatB [Sphingomonas ursincola]MBA1374561.1 twin-arginine translocase subunit TatB [Sphingomonas ursincola]